MKHPQAALRLMVRQSLELDPARQVATKGGLSHCEGQAFEEHECNGPVQMNEVLIPRNVFQKVAKRKQLYFFSKVNCSLNCPWFHAARGHTKKYRAWFRARMERIYGRRTVDLWLANAPLKIKPR